MGIYSIFQNKATVSIDWIWYRQLSHSWNGAILFAQKKSTGAVAVRTPYIRVVGLQVDQHNNGRGNPVFTDAEEEEYIRMSRQPNLYETFASSIAPSIFGNAGTTLSLYLLVAQ